MSTFVPYHHMPFPADWAHPRRFEENRWHRPRVVDRGLAAFSRTVGPKLFGQEYTQHPLGLDYAWLGNRWRIIEAGVMVAELASPGDYPERLRAADQYIGACAELQAGLVLKCMGFSVQRDPANAEARSSREDLEAGPDWRACRGTRSFGVEVKCPLQSDEAIGLDRLRSEIFFALQQLLPMDVRGLEIQVDPTVVGRLVLGRTVNKKLVEEVVLEALIDLEVRGEATTRLGVMRDTGTNLTSIQLPPPNQAREVSRLRDLLQKAASQLGVLRDPGIVILDATYDRVLPFRCCDLAEILEEPFANELALVMVAVPTLPGALLTLIRGRRYDEFEKCRVAGLWFCPRGHLHVPTLAPPPDCSFERSYAVCPDCFCHFSKRRR